MKSLKWHVFLVPLIEISVENTITSLYPCQPNMYINKRNREHFCFDWQIHQHQFWYDYQLANSSYRNKFVLKVIVHRRSYCEPFIATSPFCMPNDYFILGKQIKCFFQLCSSIWQIVRADLQELADLDLEGAPYGYTPFCDSRREMDGFRFWKQGYWANHLNGRPYHISALYVVDLHRFRQLAAGDRLRGQYHGLSQDPESLSNLDQDLPNNMIHQVFAE